MTFSVLTAVHQGESVAHLDSALTSIWDSQKVKPGEIVLVKDGPLTNVLENAIRNWELKLGFKLKVLKFSENRGLGAALKEGLEACRFGLVARMDTDDIASPDRFEKQLAFLNEHPEVDILGSFVQEMSYCGDILQVRNVPVTHEEIVSCLWASPMVHPSIMMRRAKALAAGNYDPRYRRRQDYEFWFRCAEKGLRFHNLPQSLLFYRFGQHTHKKQPPSLAWEQAMIGFRGASRLGLPPAHRLACFIPFVRSLLPSRFQHGLYQVLRPFDPRRRS